MRHRYFVLAMLMLGALAAPLTSRATGEIPVNSYTQVSLGSLGGLAAEASGINDAGQVVGTSRTAAGNYRAFLWEHGVMAELGTLPGTIHSGGTAINSQGQVVGWCHSDTANYRAFLWDGAGGMSDLGHLGGASTMPLSINDAGQVTGWSRLANGQTHAFLWQSGQMFDLGTLPGATGSTGYGIDAAGQIAGSSGDGIGGIRAFLWKPSTPNALSGAMAALSSSNSEALSINDSQQAVGWSAAPDYEPQPVLWDASGAHPLPLLWPERWNQTAVGGVARDINNMGYTVGTLRFAETWFDSEGWESVIYVDDAVIWNQVAGARRISMFTGFPIGEVRAVNLSGQILGSEYLLNPSPLPVRPSELRVYPFVEDGRVSLAWGPGNGAESYTVKRAAVSGGPYATLASGVVGTSYTDLSVANGSRYYYVVSAVNAYGTSANSNETVGSPQSLPAPPTGLTAIAGIEEVSLSWNASPSSDYYRIDFSETSGGPYDLLDYSTGTTYENPWMAGGVTYYFVVTAINSAGESGYSNQASATPTLPPSPSAPTELTATPGDARVTLSWNESVGADYSVVKRSTSSSGPFATVTSLVGSSYLDAGLANGTRYYYVITAVNRGGESPASNVASAVPTAPPVPAAPTALAASAGKKKVTLTWKQSTTSGVTQNRVYRSTGSGFSLRATLPAGVSYSDTSLTRGKTYTYKVTAVTGAGVESAYSNQASAMPK